VAPECIGVKAKKSEGMGYTGDGTGIACYAVALLDGAPSHPERSV
jgi:2C-methyl-D-erythritol 2,4-cyclodiphosphate synthase